MKIGLSVIETTKSDEGEIIHLFGRDENLTKQHIRVYNFKPFFYVDALETIKRNASILKIELLDNWNSIDHKPIKRIYTNFTEDITGKFDFKTKIKEEGLMNAFKTTYEADIKSTSRFALETGIKSGFEIEDDILDYSTDTITSTDFKTDLRRVHIDIETSTKDSGGRFPSIKNAINRIYCISCFDTYTKIFTTFVYKSTFKQKTYQQTYSNPIEIENQFDKSYPVVLNTFTNEIDMLKAFIEYMHELSFDIGAGWNFKKFDMPYIVARCKRLHIDVRKLSPLNSVWLDDKEIAHAKGFIIFDTWLGYKKLQTTESKSTKLGFVANKIFKIGKIKHKGFDFEYEHNINKLIKYNIQDVFLDYAIGEQQKIFQFFYDIKCFVGCSYEEVLNNSRIVDMYMLFKAKKKQIALPTNLHSDEEESDKSEGAIVLLPAKPGIEEFISVFDLKSLYPNCILTLNMGADTIVLNPKPEEIPKLIKSAIEDVYFTKEYKSFLAEVISELLDYRDELRAIMKGFEKNGNLIQEEIYNRIQTVVKFITNSIFGVMGLDVFRLFDKNIFDNILTLARIVITFTMKIAKKYGYKIRYGDTDSIFVKMMKKILSEVLIESEELAKKFNSMYSKLNQIFNIDSNTLKIKVDEVFQTHLMVKSRDGKKVAKKRYAGVIENDRLVVKGFDRTDMSTVGNRIMMTILEYAVRKRVKDIVPYLKEEIKKIKEGFYELEDIAFSVGISKSFDEYENKNNRIKGAEWTNQHAYLWGKQTNYGAGSKPRFVFVDPMKLPKGYQRIELIALDEDDELPQFLFNCIDWNTHLEKTIKDKIDMILEAVGISWNDIFTDIKIKKNSDY